MAEAFELTTFGGHGIGPATVYNCLLAEEDDIVVSGELALVQRASLGPTVERTSLPGRVIVVRSDGPDNDDPAAAAYRQNMDAWFDPALNAKGSRILERYADDGTTLIQIPCYVTERRFSGRGSNAYVLTLFSPQQAWTRSSATSSGNNPATVTNPGTIDVSPIVTLQNPTTTLTHRACTVADNSGRGLLLFPTWFDLNDPAATTGNVHVFVNGRLVDSNVDNSGAADSRVAALINCAADGSTTRVDILYGTGITNPKSQKLSEAGQNYTTATNISWQWRGTGWDVFGYPDRPGAWKPARLGNHSAASEASFQITASGNTCVISLGTKGTYPEGGYDSIVLALGGVQANVINAMANLRRVTAGLDGLNARAFVRFQTAGSQIWQDAWTTSANGTVTTAVDLDNAVKIAIGIENFGDTADAATLTIDSASTLTLSLTAGPTVVVGSAVTYDRYDGAYSITDGTDTYSITFDELWVPDGILTIDCVAKRITSNAAGLFLTNSGELGYAFSDPDHWLVVPPGLNTITDGLGATDTVSFEAGYA